MSINPIEAAVAPFKSDAIKRAEEEARALVGRRIERLSAHGWDLDKAAPYPDSLRCDKRTYKEQLRRRNALEAITRSAHTTSFRRSKDPYIVCIAQDRIDAFIDQCKIGAAYQYDAFVAKLVAKVGDCDQATIEGNHVWDHSILTVVKGDKAERWKTQQIVNVSVLGLLFNQWPTRKIK